MIDRVTIVLLKRRAIEYYKENITVFSRVNRHTGESEYYNYDFHGFYVLIRGCQITIKGSIQKFFHGNNYTHFSRSEIELAVERIKKMFLIEGDEKNLKITLFEFGVNIPTDYLPMEYASSMLSYVGNNFQDCRPKKRTTKIWGRVCYATNFDIKFYDKRMETLLRFKGSLAERTNLLKLFPENLLRFEIVYNRVTGTKYICNLNDLYCPVFLNRIKEDLIKKYKKIKKWRKLDISKMTAATIRKYHAGRVPDYWDDLKKMFPDTYKEERKIYKRIEEECKYDWDLTDELREKAELVIKYLISH